MRFWTAVRCLLWCSGRLLARNDMEQELLRACVHGEGSGYTSVSTFAFARGA